MFEKYFPTVRRVNASASSFVLLDLIDANWRCAPWWPSDIWESNRTGLLRMLATAHHERIDATILLANFAEEHRGRFRRRVRRLVQRVRSGTSIIDALEQTPGLLSEAQTLAIRFGNQSGTLATTYRELINESENRSFAPAFAKRNAILYGLAMLVIIPVICMFLAIFIVPKLNEIGSEYGVIGANAAVDAPVFSSLLTSIQFFSQTWFIWVLLLPFAIWLLASPTMQSRISQEIPFGLSQSRQLAMRGELLRMLARVVEAGRPLPGAISTLARYHFNRAFRGRLLFARNEVEQGSEIWASLAAAELLTSDEASALAHSFSTETTVWTLRKLANQLYSTSERRSTIAASWWRPMFILIVATVVLFVTYAFFEYINSLIVQLAP